MIVGIISYLPEDSAIREQRKSAHQKQLEWLRSILPDTPIYVAQRGYREEDFVDGINYISADPGVGAARNNLFREFYRTDEDFMLILDDDFGLYDYYGGDEMLREVNDYPEKFMELDLINFSNPTKAGFRKPMMDNREIVEKYYTFNSIASKQVCLAIVKNFKKYYNKEYFFYNEPTAYSTIAEDYEFIFQLILDGLNAVTGADLIGKVFSNLSTVTDYSKKLSNSKQHIEMLNSTYLYLAKKYELPMTDVNQIRDELTKRVRTIRKSKNLRPYKDILIEREHPHVFTEKELDYKPRKKS